MSELNGNGKNLGCIDLILEHCAKDAGRTKGDLTVLSAQRDPYRWDRQNARKAGTWFQKQIERFVPEGEIHLRGLHYRITVAADVLMPDGEPYINSDDCWEWLQEPASKAARWLGFVPFERIVDERNEAPILFVPEPGLCAVEWVTGQRVLLPEDEEEIFPRALACNGDYHKRQPYRIILFGEKTSLKEVLLPFAREVNGELILPTGEASDTLIYDVAKRAAADARQAVILYFSDFDPSGHQMAISVSRKIQALCDLRFPDLEIELHPVALTLEQVEELNLPSTPLKKTEKRADKWRESMGHEQVEIDALLALHPEALPAITRKALGPFFDFTLAERSRDALRDWYQERDEVLAESLPYNQSVKRVEKAYEEVKKAVATFTRVQQEEYDKVNEIELPDLEVPEVEIEEDPPEALFDSSMDYIESTDRLNAHKNMELI